MKHLVLSILIFQTSVHAAAGYDLQKVKRVMQSFENPSVALLRLIQDNPLPSRDRFKQSILHVLATGSWEENSARQLVRSVLNKCPVDQRQSLLDAYDCDQNTALHIAATHSNNMLEALVTVGATLTLGDRNNNIPLHSAVMNGNNDAVEILCEAFHPPLPFYIDQSNGYDETPLTCALRVADVDSFYILLSAGALYHSASFTGRTPLGRLFKMLHDAQIRSIHTKKIQQLSYVDKQEDSITILQEMLRSGCQLSIADTFMLRTYKPGDIRLQVLLSLALQPPSERAYKPEKQPDDVTVVDPLEWMKREIHQGRDTFFPNEKGSMPLAIEQLGIRRRQELKKNYAMLRNQAYDSQHFFDDEDC